MYRGLDSNVSADIKPQSDFQSDMNMLGGASCAEALAHIKGINESKSATGDVKLPVVFIREGKEKDSPGARVESGKDNQGHATETLYRSDGTKEAVWTYGEGRKSINTKLFYEDGKTARSEETWNEKGCKTASHFRKDGTKALVEECDADGKKVSKAFYSNDGKRITSKDTWDNNGWKMTTSFREDETRWFVDNYDRDGKRVGSAFYTADGKTVHSRADYKHHKMDVYWSESSDGILGIGSHRKGELLGTYDLDDQGQPIKSSWRRR